MCLISLNLSRSLALVAKSAHSHLSRLEQKTLLQSKLQITRERDTIGHFVSGIRRKITAVSFDSKACGSGSGH